MIAGQYINAYLPRRLRLLFVNLVEQLLETILKGLVFGALVKFAHEMAAGAEGVVAESQGSIAKILPVEKGRCFSQCTLWRYEEREGMVEILRERRE